MFGLSYGWLFSSLFGWLVHQLVAPSIHVIVSPCINIRQSISQSVIQSVSQLVSFLLWFIDWSIVWLVHQSVSWLVCSLFSRSVSCKSIDALIAYLENLFLFQLIGWYFDKLLIDCLIFWAVSRWLRLTVSQSAYHSLKSILFGQ